MKRTTQQKRAIRLAFEEAGRPLTVGEVFEASRRHVPSLNLATVYRNLKAMVRDRALHAVRIPGEPSRYEQSGKGHHHHFQCESCGRVFDIPCRIEDSDTEVPREFEVSRHEVMVYGRCEQCA